MQSCCLPLPYQWELTRIRPWRRKDCPRSRRKCILHEAIRTQCMRHCRCHACHAQLGTESCLCRINRRLVQSCNCKHDTWTAWSILFRMRSTQEQSSTSSARRSMQSIRRSRHTFHSFRWKKWKTLWIRWTQAERNQPWANIGREFPCRRMCGCKTTHGQRSWSIKFHPCRTCQDSSGMIMN